MSDERAAFRLELGTFEELEREAAQNLRNGGAMIRCEAEAAEGESRSVVIVHPLDGRTLELAARVVWVGDQAGARVVGLAFDGFGPEMRERISSFVAGPTAPAPSNEEKSSAERVHERMRGLSVAEQQRMAREGEASERVILERIYGKSVWEPLLKNPRLTVPEVARIAHMGNLPVPLVELIVANGAWLTSSLVRRALLANPRLKGEAALRVLRAMPHGELKLVPKQTAYPALIREAARKLLGP